jgi:hypothetical protein
MFHFGRIKTLEKKISELEQNVKPGETGTATIVLIPDNKRGRVPFNTAPNYLQVRYERAIRKGGTSTLVYDVDNPPSFLQRVREALGDLQKE